MTWHTEQIADKTTVQVDIHNIPNLERNYVTGTRSHILNPNQEMFNTKHDIPG